jgi:hypothetical protein
VAGVLHEGFPRVNQRTFQQIQQKHTHTLAFNMKSTVRTSPAFSAHAGSSAQHLTSSGHKCRRENSTVRGDEGKEEEQM